MVGSSILNFLRKVHIVLHKAYTVTISFPPDLTSVPFFPHPLQNLFFLVLLMIVILAGMSWYLTDLHFPNENLVRVRIFSYVFWPFVCLLGESGTIFLRGSLVTCMTMQTFDCHWHFQVFILRIHQTIMQNVSNKRQLCKHFKQTNSFVTTILDVEDKL